MRLKIQTNGCFSNALLFQPSLDRQVLGNSGHVDVESPSRTLLDENATLYTGVDRLRATRFDFNVRF